MSKEHAGVVRGRESVSAFPVCNTSEMHPTQIDEQLLDHEDLKCMSECESLILVRLRCVCVGPHKATLFH